MLFRVLNNKDVYPNTAAVCFHNKPIFLALLSKSNALHVNYRRRCIHYCFDQCHSAGNKQLEIHEKINKTNLAINSLESLCEKCNSALQRWLCFFYFLQDGNDNVDDDDDNYNKHNCYYYRNY